MKYRLVYITTKDEEEAREIGRVLGGERLAACVNIHPIKSVCRWEGEIEEADEVALLVKTSAHLIDMVVSRVREMHSYEVPCIISLPIEKGYPDFLKWIDRSTK